MTKKRLKVLVKDKQHRSAPNRTVAKKGQKGLDLISLKWKLRSAQTLSEEWQALKRLVVRMFTP